jgi:hypothetical protein
MFYQPRASHLFFSEVFSLHRISQQRKMRRVSPVSSGIAVLKLRKILDRGTLYPQKFSLTSPTSGGRSVCIVHSRTQATEFLLDFLDP